MANTSINQRKADHIRVNLEEDVGFLHLTTGLERLRFIHQALPELNLDDVDTSHELFGKRLSVPLLISSMTGGTERAYEINMNLATAAQEFGVAMGVGSQRASIVNMDPDNTFDVRSVAPDILLFSNIGAIQLNYGFGIDECRRAVEMIEADGLILHLNPLQEVFQIDGDINWSGLIDKIAAVCAALSVPVIVKEVGWGISRKTAQQLIEAGVMAIDVAGAGGTSWSQVEMHRDPTERLARLGKTFRDWGIPTVESLRAISCLREELGRHDLTLFASGGVRSGLDVAKCVALGADLVGLAGPFLKRAVESTDAVLYEMNILREELSIAMFCSGVGDVETLKHSNLLVEI